MTAAAALEEMIFGDRQVEQVEYDMACFLCFKLHKGASMKPCPLCGSFNHSEDLLELVQEVMKAPWGWLERCDGFIRVCIKV